MMIAAAILIASSLLYLLWPGGGVSWKSYEEIRLGMRQADVRDLLGGPPDTDFGLLGQVARGGSPGCWYRCQSWHADDLTIVVDVASDLVVRRDAMPGPGFHAKRHLARLFRHF